MVLTYYHSSKMGPHISLTFPAQTAVISTATHPSFALLFDSFFFSLAHSSSFSSYPCPFLNFSSGLLHVIGPSCLPLSVSLFLPHLLPFCSFLCFFTFMSHLIPIFRVCGHVCPELSLCQHPTLSSFFLSLSMEALSHDPCFSCKCNLFTYFSFSILFFSLSLFKFPSVVLLCLAPSRQGC